MRRFAVQFVAALLLAGCGSPPQDQALDRIDGVRMDPLRIVPPPPGECVGAVEVTIVNEGSTPADVGRLDVLQFGNPSDCDVGGPMFDEDGPAFATFDTYDASFQLEPGASCILRKPMVRSPLRRAAAAPVPIRGHVVVAARPEVRSQLTTQAVEVDPASWPVPEAMTAKALDRAIAAGHRLHILFYEIALPYGGMSALELRPDGRAHGAGSGRLAERARPGAFRVAGALTPAQQEALLVSLRRAPFSAFECDPRWHDVMDGSWVRLLVAAGPVAFVACSQEDDFDAAGLTPLLEQLRGLVRELPEVAETR